MCNHSLLKRSRRLGSSVDSHPKPTDNVTFGEITGFTGIDCFSQGIDLGCVLSFIFFQRPEPSTNYFTRVSVLAISDLRFDKTIHLRSQVDIASWHGSSIPFMVCGLAIVGKRSLR
jgi:hypothetical protein